MSRLEGQRPYMPVKYHENAKTIKGVEVAVKETGDTAVKFTSVARLEETL